MPTVFNRLYAYTKNNKEPMLPLEHRQIVGNLIKKEFFKNFQLPVFKRKQLEYGKEFTVLDYHPDFKERMDKLILNYYRKLKRNNVKFT